VNSALLFCHYLQSHTETIATCTLHRSLQPNQPVHLPRFPVGKEVFANPLQPSPVAFAALPIIRCPPRRFLEYYYQHRREASRPPLRVAHQPYLGLHAISTGWINQSAIVAERPTTHPRAVQRVCWICEPGAWPTIGHHTAREMCR
jgi:hypothetical protein